MGTELDQRRPRRRLLRFRTLILAAIAATFFIPSAASAQNPVLCTTIVIDQPVDYVMFGVNTFYWQTGIESGGQNGPAEEERNFYYFRDEVSEHPTDVDEDIEDFEYFGTYAIYIGVLSGIPNRPGVGGYAGAYFVGYGPGMANKFVDSELNCFGL